MSDAEKYRSIRAKMIVLVAASVSVAVGLLTTIAMFREGGRDAALQGQRLAAIADVVASAAAKATAKGDTAGAFEALRSAGRAKDVIYGRVEDAEGIPLAENGVGARLSTDVVVTKAPSGLGGMLSLLKSRTVRVQSQIVDENRQVGRVVLLARSEGVGARLAWSLLTSLEAGLSAVLVGLLLAWRMQRTITSPIIALTRSMDEIQRTHDYDMAVQVSSNDEVGDLVDGFNRMLSEIRVRDRELAHHMAGLERTVAQRTADMVLARDAAEMANRAKSDFLATMSHEIRTPMNGIMVMAEMLAADELPPRQRRFADVIAKSGASLIAIINDILDFSKIEAGKLELERKELDPAAVVEDVCSLFWERARAKSLELAAYVDPATPALVMGDEVRLRQVLSNLVANAIKFTEKGGVMVEVGPTKAGGLKFGVRDTGIGIPREKVASLFQAFTQADQSTTRRFGGTGLGLSISKRLVDAMGGKFAVSSRPGEGSLFAFTAPLEEAAPAPPWPAIQGIAGLDVPGEFTALSLRRYLEATGMTIGRGRGTSVTLRVGAPATFDTPQIRMPAVCVAEFSDARPQLLLEKGVVDAVMILPVRRQDFATLLGQLAEGQPLALVSGASPEPQKLHRFEGYKVLVADDSDVNREVAVEALSRLGIQPLLAEDGRQALAMWEAEGFDLILMDGSMPEMDGYEAASAIRAREAELGRERTPIVALTAHVVGPAAGAWRDSGMDAVLHKPFTLAQMAGALGQFLKPRGRELAAEEPPAAPAGLAAADGDLIDAKVASELASMAAAGREDFVTRVHGLYRLKAPETADGLRQALERRDQAAAVKAAHALKSMSLNVGAKAVAQFAARLESEGRAGAPISLADAAEIDRLLAATLQALDGGPPPPTTAITPSAPAAEPEPEPDPAIALVGDEPRLRDALALALRNGEFSLAYQPQMDRDGKRMIGCEALVRWTRPDGRAVGPQLFIPAAERLGLIREVTDWVLDRCLMEAGALEVPVAVNASAVEFGRPDFCDRVARALARHGRAPGKLEIEITETAMLQDEEAVRRTIAGLRELGVGVALDDFGTGYSSLQRLRRFAFDKLKIDREFISSCSQDVQSATIVHAVVSIGRALGMKVIAEGVETEEEHQFLRIAGAHGMQGYLFCRPLPMTELMEFAGSGRLALAS